MRQDLTLGHKIRWTSPVSGDAPRTCHVGRTCRVTNIAAETISKGVVMKASIYCIAMAGVLCLATSASAQQPVASPHGCCNGQPGAYQSGGAPVNGSYGDCGNAYHG